jgi:uncharacterized protein GlcG (DUF336 family)
MTQKFFIAALVLFLNGAAMSQEASFQTKSLTPETALNAAKAAMDACRKKGYQVTVAIVDRAGLTQILIRDRFAGPHTIDVATNKAWTAASMKMSTTVFAAETQAGKPMSALRSHARVMAAGRGLVIEGAGTLLGGIGVSGAPGGDADDACANAGLKAISEALEF